MPAQSTFAYRAREADGRIVSGTMSAADAREVGNRLRADGKYLLDVDDRPMRGEVRLDAWQIRRNEAARRVRRDDVIAFCEQLSVMLDTGVPLAEALDAFQAQTRSREFKVVLEVLREDIYAGETFSDAASKWPRVFPTVMTSLLRASEASGTMALMLGRVGSYLAKERKTVRQIKGALAYPAFMMGAALMLSLFLMLVILPKFAAIYEGRSATLPAATTVLLTISRFLVEEWKLYLPIVGGTLTAGAVFVRRPTGRRTLDWLRLNVPILKSMYEKLYVTRASRTMGTLLQAGVGLLDIIAIVRGVTNNDVFDGVWDQMEADIRDGKRMSDSFAECRYIPPNVSSMVASGERSGRLGDVMDRIAEFSEQELDNAVRQVTAYIEPIMIICMGTVVGGVAIALLLPIFRMGQVMSGG